MSDTYLMRGTTAVPGVFSRLQDVAVLVVKGAIALLMVAMMLLITVDVVGRYLFTSPLPGAYEIVQVMLGLTTFLALPLVTLGGSHVTISLVDSVLGARIRALRDVIVMVVSVLVVAVLAVSLWGLSGRLAESGQTLGAIEIPLSPVAYTFGALLWVTMAAQLVMLARCIGTLFAGKGGKA